MVCKSFANEHGLSSIQKFIDMYNAGNDDVLKKQRDLLVLAIGHSWNTPHHLKNKILPEADRLMDDTQTKYLGPNALVIMLAQSGAGIENITNQLVELLAFTRPSYHKLHGQFKKVEIWLTDPAVNEATRPDKYIILRY